MTLKKINILEYPLREGGGGHSKAYSMYAFINVDNCERPLKWPGICIKLWEFDLFTNEVRKCRYLFPLWYHIENGHG